MVNDIFILFIVICHIHSSVRNKEIFCLLKIVGIFVNIPVLFLLIDMICSDTVFFFTYCVADCK